MDFQNMMQLGSAILKSCKGDTQGAVKDVGSALLGHFQSKIKNPEIGVNGFLNNIESNLGPGGDKIVESWKSTGENMPITGEQAASAMPDAVNLATGILSKAFNVDPKQMEGITKAAANVVAVFLPGAVDHVTPGGKTPSPAEASSLLQNVMRQFTA